jgi:hypothetical protein
MNRHVKAQSVIGAVLLLATIIMTSILRKELVTKNMSNPQEQSHDSLLRVLEATGRSNELTDGEDIYGWLVGSWEATVYDYAADGAARESSGEWHFGWVLEGRAIQDVFIVPSRSQRSGQTLSKRNDRYGTSLRIYDREISAWRVTWLNPVTGAHDELTGWRKGKDIVQEGRDKEGRPMRWVFTDISHGEFRWYGERSHDGGKTWRLEVEFFAKKREL